MQSNLGAFLSYLEMLVNIPSTCHNPFVYYKFIFMTIDEKAHISSISSAQRQKGFTTIYLRIIRSVCLKADDIESASSLTSSVLILRVVSLSSLSV